MNSLKAFMGRMFNRFVTFNASGLQRASNGTATTYFALWFSLALTLSSAILVAQDPSFISGHTTFHGTYNQKVDQIYLILLLIVAVFSALVVTLVSNKIELFVGSENGLPIGPKPKIHTGNRLRSISLIFSVVAIATILEAYFFSDRFSHNGGEKEILFYITLAIAVYLYSAISYRDPYGALVFPLISLMLFTLSPVTMTGDPISYFNLSPDMYHTGERFIPGKLISENKIELFGDYYPSRGATNYYAGIFANFFGNGDRFEMYAYYQHSTVFYTFATISFVLLIRTGLIVRSTFAVLLGLFANGDINSAVGLLLVVAWFTASTFDLKRPIRTAACVVIASSALLVHSVSMGTVFILSAGIVFALQTIKQITVIGGYSRNEWIAIAAVPLVAILAVVVFFPGLLGYVSGNGSINLAAHGILNPDLTMGIHSLKKYAFLYLTPILLVLAHQFCKLPEFEVNYLFITIIVGVVLVGLIRFMGRDDIGSLSRPFAASLLVSFTLALVLFRSYSHIGHRFGRNVAFAIAVLLLFFFAMFGQMPARILAWDTPIGTTPVFDDRQPKNVVDSVKSVADFRQFYADGYCAHLVDLTGNNAIYAYSDELSIIPITSSYNSASDSDQIANIRRLNSLAEQGGVCVRILHQNLSYDGRGMLLRAPRIAQHLLRNSTITDVAQNIGSTGVWLKLPADAEARRAETREEYLALKSYFDLFLDLNHMPRIWGQGESLQPGTLQNATNSLPIDPSWLAKRAHASIYHSDPAENDCTLNLIASSGAQSTLRYKTGAQGVYIVPLYGSFDWYFEDVQLIESGCSTAKITSVGILPD